MRLHFADFVLDTGRDELRRGEERIELEPRALRLLALLLERKGDVVGKDEILDSLWPGVAVAEGSITRLVHLVRAALGDRDREHPIIRTIYGRGYQIAVPVETAEGSREAESSVGPGAAIAEPRAVFIGRSEPMAALLGAVEGLRDGRGSAFVICGEAGIGKTRIVERVRERAKFRDARVLWGRCPDGAGATPYWPWTQALSDFTGSTGSESLRSVLGSRYVELVTFFPDLKGGSEDRSAPEVWATPDSSARHRTFAALIDLLASISNSGPVVVVLEDLHWADPPSLMLFAAAAQDLRDRPVLLLATCRTTEPLTPELDAALVEARQRSAVVELQGFSRDEIEQFVTETSDLEAPEATIDRLLEQTAGNPLFLTELMRVECQVRGLPGERTQSVGDLVRARIARLDEPCRHATEALAVIGRDAPLELIAAALGLEPRGGLAALVDTLERARHAGIVAVRRTVSAGPTYQFIHDLIREVVYEGIPAAERAATHERIGNALLAIHGTGDPEVLPRLAHHFCEAALLGDPTRAIEYSLLAGEQADGVFGWEESATHYRRALSLLERDGKDTARQRAHVLVKLGRSLDLAGHPDAEDTFHRAAVLAREHGEGDDFARVVLSFPLHVGGIVWLEPIDEKRAQARRRLALIHEALEDTGHADSGQRAQLLARSVLLDARRSAPAACRRRALEGIEQARASGDSAVIAEVLRTSVWSLWAHQTYPELRLSIDEAIDRLAQLGDRTGLLDAFSARIMAAKSWADAATARADLAAYARLAKAEHHERHQWLALLHESVDSLVEFDSERAEALVVEAMALAKRLDTVDETLGIFSGLLREQGRLGEFVAYVDERDEATSEEEVRWRLALVFILAEIGELGRASELLDTLADLLPISEAEQHVGRPGIRSWPIGLAFAADAVVLLDRPSGSTRLYDAILEWRGRNVHGPAMTPHLGPFDLRLGNLASLRGDYDLAVQHIEDAIGIAERSQAPLHVTHCRAALANALYRRAHPNDVEHARKLAAEVREVYESHRIEHFSKRLSVD